MEKLSLGLLRQARRRANVTVEEAALTVGRGSRSFIWRVESGITDIKVGDLLRLLKRYGKSVTDVFVRVPEGEDSYDIV